MDCLGFELLLLDESIVRFLINVAAAISVCDEILGKPNEPITQLYL